MMKRMGRINIRVSLSFIVLITILSPMESRGGHAGHHLPEKRLTALPLSAGVMYAIQQFSGADEKGNRGEGSADEDSAGDNGDVPCGLVAREIDDSAAQ